MLVLLFNYTLFVRLTGLEPAHRKTPDPKSGASTNFATDATIVLLTDSTSIILFFLFQWQR